MFIPNGQGTIEWHLGLTIDIPDAYFLLVMEAHRIQNLEVPVGVLDRHTLLKMNDTLGISIAIRPTGDSVLKRGQPIARIVLLHPNSLKASE